MQIFSKRSQAGRAARAKAGRGAPAPTPQVGAQTLSGARPAVELVERVVALQAQRLSREALAREVLPGFLAIFGGIGGALLLYHPEEETLTLAAEQGLSESGRQHLETVRAGARGGWEIPLHGLLNHKAYIIERPQEHRLIPELVPPQSFRTIATIACIPLYRGWAPVAVLVVVGGPQPIRESDVLAGVLAFDVLALALDPAAHGVLAPPAHAAPEEGVPLACEAWVDPQETATRLAGELASLREERDALHLRVAELESRQAEGERMVEAVRVEAAELVAAGRATAEDRLRAERATAEGLLEELRVRIREAEAQLAAERGTVEARVAEIREVLAEREAGLARHQEHVAEQNGTLAERTRALADAVAERDRAQQVARDLGVELRRVHDEVAAQRVAHERDMAALEATCRDERAAVEDQRETSARLRAEVARLQDVAAVATAEAAGAVEAAARVREETTRANEAAARADEERARAAEAATEAREETARAVEAAARVREETSRANEAAARADEERARAVEAATRASAEATAAGEQLKRERAAARTALGELRTKLRASDTARAAERTAAEAALAEARTVLEERERAAAEHARALAGERDAALRAAAEGAATGRQLWDDLERVTQELATVRAAHADAATAASAAVGQAESLAAELAAVRGAHTEVVVRADAAAARADALAVELAAARRELAALREDRERVLAAVDDPGAEPAAVIRALRERVATLEGAAAEGAAARCAADAQLADLRNELAALRGTLARREQELGEIGQERDRACGTARAAEEAGAGLRRECEQLQIELTAARRELTVLREDRERVLAAVDDPGAEPAAVIRALRAQVAALESAASESVAVRRAADAQLADLRNEVAALEALREEQRGEHEKLRAGHAHEIEALRRAEQREVDRLRQDLQAARAQLREAVARVEDARSTAQAPVARAEERLAAEREAYEQTLATLRAELAERETALADRERVADELAAERDRALTAAREAGDVIRRLHGEIEGAKLTVESVQEAHAQAVARAEALAGQTAALEEELAAQRADMATLRAAREQVCVEHGERIGALERDLVRSEEMLASATRQLAAVVERARRTAGTVEPVPPPQRPTPDAPDQAQPGSLVAAPEGMATAAPPRAALPADTPPAPAVAAPGAWRVLEADAARRQEIETALGAGLTVAATRRLVVANVLAAIASGLDELLALPAGETTLVGYAADDAGRSRILGGLQLFTDPPDATQITAALAPLNGGPRRIIVLSDDVDAFVAAKSGIVRAGHSVSMACDAKQACDLLAMLTPDAVLVDVRHAPEAVAGFLAAFAPESGRVHSLLVCGGSPAPVLSRLVTRLLRPEPLNAADLARACRCVLAGPQVTTPEKRAPQPPRLSGRNERPKPTPRITLARRFLTGRR